MKEITPSDWISLAAAGVACLTAFFQFLSSRQNRDNIKDVSGPLADQLKRSSENLEGTHTLLREQLAGKDSETARAIRDLKVSVDRLKSS